MTGIKSIFSYVVWKIAARNLNTVKRLWVKKDLAKLLKYRQSVRALVKHI